MTTKPRIAIIGAGPIGLEAALYARLKGYEVTVYERGEVAAHVAWWGHVTMFSPFGMNSSEWGRGALVDAGTKLPADDALLTGAEFRKRYLLPLADLPVLRPCLREQTSVSGLTRKNQNKHENAGTPQRAATPFQFLVEESVGEFDQQQSFEHADVVLDCTGTSLTPRHLGPGGAPCIGEEDLELELRIDYWPFRPSDARQNSFDGNELVAALEFLVIGSGHSAATTITALAEYAKQEPDVLVHWLTRLPVPEPIKRIENDPLSERDRLAAAANRLALLPDSCIHWMPGWSVVRIEADDADFEDQEPLSVTIEHSATGETETLEVDRIIANVGFRPDRSLYEELQVHECYATQGPMKLAANLLGETSADCLDQTSHGAEVLRNPEPNFYILGMKSYGRNSNFLIQIGLQQIIDVFSLIEKDWNL